MLALHRLGAHAHAVVLVLCLLLHRQLLQCGIDVQLVGLELAQQCLPLEEVATLSSVPLTGPSMQGLAARGWTVWGRGCCVLGNTPWSSTVLQGPPHARMSGYCTPCEQQAWVQCSLGQGWPSMRPQQPFRHTHPVLTCAHSSRCQNSLGKKGRGSYSPGKPNPPALKTKAELAVPLGGTAPMAAHPHGL